MDSMEKAAHQHEEYSTMNEKSATGYDTPVSEEGEGVAFTPAQTRSLLWKLDWHLVPFLSVLYLLSFLDRTNIGNARLFNLVEDLGMNPAGLDYNISLAVFFPFYVMAEIPSNMMMKKLRPSVWLTTIMLAWAIVVIFMGFVSNFAGLCVARAFLGIAEGGLFPGVTYYITMWYPRHECGLRIALFFSAATAAGAFGGLLARGIGAMAGVAGKGGWAWIFIIEGLLTLVVAAVAYWCINDYPATAKFLTPVEKVEVERRLKADRSSLADDFNLKYFFDALKDWKIYVNMLITMGIYTPLYSISLFLPTIIKVMGNGQYTPEMAQLLSVPPYVVACFFTISAGFLADRMKQRGIFMIVFLLVAIIGWSLLLSSGAPTQQYVGCFFAVSGIYPLVPLGVAWTGNNIGGSLKRGVGIAMHVGWGNLGGCIAAFMYLAKDSPRFQPGHATLIGFMSMSLVLSLFMTIYFRRENARRDAAYKAPELYTEEEKLLERENGDNATFFRYTI